MFPRGCWGWHLDCLIGKMPVFFFFLFMNMCLLLFVFIKDGKTRYPFCRTGSIFVLWIVTKKIEGVDTGNEIDGRTLPGCLTKNNTFGGLSWAGYKSLPMLLHNFLTNDYLTAVRSVPRLESPKDWGVKWAVWQGPLWSLPQVSQSPLTWLPLLRSICLSLITRL